MEIRQMIYLVEICNGPSLSAAAERLYLTPQALSKAIHALEEELKSPLFFREKGRLLLTPFGRRVLREVKPFVDDYNDLCEQLGRLSMYVDSVALLDYGFNAFTQVTYPVQDIAADIKANDAALVTTDPVTLLLANGMQESSLQKTYSIESSSQYGMQVQVKLSLPDAAGVQYATVATAHLQYALPLGGDTVQLPATVPLWQTVLQWAGIVLGCAAALFVLLLIAVRLRYDLRRLRSKRRRAKALAGASGRVKVQPGVQVRQTQKRKSV